MRKILLVVPVSALVIAALVAYRVTRPPDYSILSPQAGADVVRPAPLFQLYDEHSQIVRIARYVGRHKMLVVFFNGRAAADQNGLLQRIRENVGGLHQAKAIVLGISDLRPAQHRAAMERDGNIPIPLLSDLDYEVHVRWGAYDSTKNQPREAVFVVDRAGMIRKSHLGPDQLGTPEQWIEELKAVP